MRVVFPVILVVWVVSVILLGYWSLYLVARDTTAFLDRAQVSADIEDMEDYMIKVKNGMEKWNLTSGYAAFIFRHPENNMKLIMRTIDKIIMRADTVKKMPKYSIEYQTAIDDLRGTIRELDIKAEYRFCISHPIWFWWSVLFGWVIIILLVILYGVYY